MKLFSGSREYSIRQITIFDYPEIPLKAAPGLADPGGATVMALIRLREYENIESMLEDVILVADSINKGCGLVNSFFSGKITGLPRETIRERLSYIPLMISRFVTDSLEYSIPLSRVVMDHALNNLGHLNRLKLV